MADFSGGHGCVSAMSVATLRGMGLSPNFLTKAGDRPSCFEGKAVVGERALVSGSSAMGRLLVDASITI